jgi:hypothetical protein
MSVTFIDAEQNGDPLLNGKYICWINPDFDVPAATHIILTWMFGQWSYPGSDSQYRGVIYGYAGPIPTLKLEAS